MNLMTFNIPQFINTEEIKFGSKFNPLKYS